VSVETFAGRAGAIPYEFSEFSGILVIRKLASLATIAPHRPSNSRFGIKRDRRKLHIEPLHLPPEESRAMASSSGSSNSTGSSSNINISNSSINSLGNLSISSSSSFTNSSIKSTASSVNVLDKLPETRSETKKIEIAFDSENDEKPQGFPVASATSATRHSVMHFAGEANRKKALADALASARASRGAVSKSGSGTRQPGSVCNSKDIEF